MERERERERERENKPLIGSASSSYIRRKNRMLHSINHISNRNHSNGNRRPCAMTLILGSNIKFVMNTGWWMACKSSQHAPNHRNERFGPLLTRISLVIQFISDAAGNLSMSFHCSANRSRFSPSSHLNQREMEREREREREREKERKRESWKWSFQMEAQWRPLIGAQVSSHLTHTHTHSNRSN